MLQMGSEIKPSSVTAPVPGSPDKGWGPSLVLIQGANFRAHAADNLQLFALV